MIGLRKVIKMCVVANRDEKGGGRVIYPNLHDTIGPGHAYTHMCDLESFIKTRTLLCHICNTKKSLAHSFF